MQAKIQNFYSPHLRWHQEHCSCFPWGVAISAIRALLISLLEFYSREVHTGDVNFVGKVATFSLDETLFE